MWTLVLSLGAATTWGVADFVGALRARAYSPLLVAVYSEAVGMVPVLAALFLVGDAFPGWDHIPWAVIAGITGSVGHVVFFIALALCFTAPGFFTIGNILNIFRNVALAGVISFGMTMTIIGGEIDLSVGSSIALSAVLTATVTGALAKAGIMPMESAVFVGMACALVVGLLIGLFNGFIRTKFNIPTFIITLAMLNVIYGSAALISRGFPVTTLPDWYNWIGAGRLFGTFPVPALWLLIVFAIVFVIMNLTRFGREVYAVGGNPESARLSGINVSKVKIIILVAVQVLAAFSGIILSAQVM